MLLNWLRVVVLLLIALGIWGLGQFILWRWPQIEVAGALVALVVLGVRQVRVVQQRRALLAERARRAEVEVFERAVADGHVTTLPPAHADRDPAV